MKKLWIILALLLALSASCAWAEEEPTVYTSGVWEYVLLEDGTAEIVSYYGTERDLIVPAEIDGYPVTSLRSHYGDVGFTWRSVGSITIPDSVVRLSTNPFVSIGTLTDIHVSPDHPSLEVRDGILFDKIEKRLICCPSSLRIESYSVPSDICSIGEYAFSGNTFLTEILIPECTTLIGDYAFAGCLSLEHVSLPKWITAIGNSAFRACGNLSEIDIPEGVTSIGDYAFFLCDLNEIDIPEGVISIGERAFFNCGAFSISLPSSLTSIGPYALGENNIRQITIPESVTFIGEWAFSGCILLETVVVTEDSYAEHWCYINNWHCLYTDDVN